MLGQDQSRGANDWLDDVWSATGGDNQFMDDKGRVRHTGNACPGLPYGPGVQLKGLAVQRSDSRLVFATDAVNFSLNPWTRGSAHLYGGGQFGFKDGDGSQTAAADSNPWRCTLRGGWGRQGPGLCISHLGSKTLSIATDLRAKRGNKYAGMVMCNLNSWCGSGNWAHYMVILYKRSPS